MSTDPLLSILPSHPPHQETTASVFDLLLIDRFSTLFKPAFDHLFNQYLVPNFPILNLFQGYREEFWCLFYASIQDYYLRTGILPTDPNNSHTCIGGSLVEESLYGWRRKYFNVPSLSLSSSVPSSSTVVDPSPGSVSTVTRRYRTFPSSVSTRIGITVLLQVILPYLRLRAKEWSIARQERYRRENERWEQQQQQQSHRRSSSSSSSSSSSTTFVSSSPSSFPHHRASSSVASTHTSSSPLSLSFLDYVAKYYPYVHTGYDIVNILYLIGYGLGISKYSSIPFHINQIQLVRGGNYDPNNGRSDKSTTTTTVANNRKDIPNFWSVMKRTVQVSIVMTLILLQLYYWWRMNHQRNNRNNNSSSSVNWKIVPPPPLPPSETLSSSALSVALPSVIEPSGTTTSSDDTTNSTTTHNNILAGCPICLRSDPDTPVVLPNGIVYCENCLPATMEEGGGEPKIIRLREA